MRRVMQVLILKEIENRNQKSELRKQRPEFGNQRRATRVENLVFPASIMADPEARSRANWYSRVRKRAV